MKTNMDIDLTIIMSIFTSIPIIITGGTIILYMKYKHCTIHELLSSHVASKIPDKEKEKYDKMCKTHVDTAEERKQNRELQDIIKKKHAKKLQKPSLN